ncbi:hypothetical protein pkur_cds_783 [Pandoravirus kuranda]|uniref:Uncharacterized protein n=1 Tax=Pandoravirus kuranda TaxID=3019033 RepID=A0AA95EF72_9VIRU|nr:hypothetical protein pkur_cds_783 [Pandoravirus kuranda]
MRRADAEDREMDTLSGGPTMEACDGEGDDDPFVVPHAIPRTWPFDGWVNACAPTARWALYLGLVVLVPLVVASVVFLPWFFVGIWPDVALEYRLHATTCVVLNHTVIDTKPVEGNMRLLYMPGIRVHVAAWSRAALATSHIKASDSWMSREVMDDYLARRPIGASVTCYVTDDDGRVAMYSTVSNNRLAPCIAVTAAVFVLVLIVTCARIVEIECKRAHEPREPQSDTTPF